MSQTSENYSWYKGKREIIQKFLGESNKVRSAIAAKGFSVTPGFVVDLMTDIELGTKFALSELNFKIAQESMERELKDYKFELDVDIKELQNAWITTKTSLLTAMEQEIALLWSVLYDDKEILKMAAIEIRQRRVTLIEAQSLLKEQLEAHRRQLDNTALLTLGKERQLIVAQGETIQERLKLIPIIEAIITVEEQLLDKLTSDLYSAKEQYADSHGELIVSEETLIDPLTEKAGAQQRLADAIMSGIGILEQVADAKVLRALARRDLMLADLEFYMNREELEVANQLQAEAKDNYSVAMIELRQALLEHKTTYINERSEADKDFIDSVLSSKLETLCASAQNSYDVFAIGQASTLSSGLYEKALKLDVMKITKENKRAGIHDHEVAKASLKLTSELVHKI